MPERLGTKTLEQQGITSVGNICIFARKYLTFHNLRKIDDSSMDTFSERRPRVTDS